MSPSCSCPRLGLSEVHQPEATAPHLRVSPPANHCLTLQLPPRCARPLIKRVENGSFSHGDGSVKSDTGCHTGRFSPGQESRPMTRGDKAESCGKRRRTDEGLCTWTKSNPQTARGALHLRDCRSVKMRDAHVVQLMRQYHSVVILYNAVVMSRL